MCCDLDFPKRNPFKHNPHIPYKFPKWWIFHWFSINQISDETKQLGDLGDVPKSSGTTNPNWLNPNWLNPDSKTDKNRLHCGKYPDLTG
jgi:hypothetical protein